MRKQQNYKNEKGITLVALVVTIVVLLILAGVSINMVLGNNGLITKAKDAKEQTESSVVKDEVSMMIGEWQIEKYVDDIGLEEYLNSKMPSQIDNVTNNGDGTFTVEKDGYAVTVDENGNIVDTAEVGPRPEVANLKVVANSDGTGNALGAKEVDEGETLYITFTHSIEGGTTTVSPAVPYAVTANGTYSFTITGTVSGENYTKVINVKVDQFKPVTTGLAIGDLVNYTYDTVAEGYSLLSTQSGYTGSNDDGSQTVPQSTTTLQWKVLNIDEENGTIDLVSSEPTDNTVYFKGALGYNNGVYLLDDMCAHLYSNSSLGVTARSIDLVDMERHLTTGENGGIAARNAYKSSTNTVYGSTYKYETNRQYPKLYAHEIGQGIGVTDGTTITQPNLNGVDPYNESSKYYTAPTTDTSDTADTALTVTQTYYSIAINDANYGPAAAVLSNSNWYWVASRYVYTNLSGLAYFGLRYAGTSMDGNSLFFSGGNPDRNYYRLRPVVSLSSDLLDGTKDASGAWNLK